ncbi:MAG TPA: CpXC domain-containing protein [Syntrophobacteria bacterium]|nr:CpXC domain-containing protein [Syntrophobacteria bacterium]
MSKFKLQKLSCARCNHTQEVPTWDSINVTLNPQLKAEFFANKINTITCGNCGYHSMIGKDLLYHDMQLRVMIFEQYSSHDIMDQLDTLKQHCAQNAFRDYRFRIVRSRRGLIEKILIFQDGFDDRVVELMKLTVISHADDLDARDDQDVLLYYCGSNEREDLLFRTFVDEAEKDVYGVSRQQYDRSREILGELLQQDRSETERFLVVDSEYVRRLVDTVDGPSRKGPWVLKDGPLK